MVAAAISPSTASTSDDLPLPTLPTTAVSCPGLHSNEKLESANPPASDDGEPHVKCAFSRRIVPSGSERSVLMAENPVSATVSIRTRSRATPACVAAGTVMAGGNSSTSGASRNVRMRLAATPASR